MKRIAALALMAAAPACSSYVRSDASTDAASIETSADAAPAPTAPLPACRERVSAWRESVARYQGPWSAAVGLRDGERTWVIAQRADRSGLVLLRFAFDGPAPTLASATPLGETADAYPLIAAMNGARIGLLTVGRYNGEDWADVVLRVIDAADGRTVARAAADLRNSQLSMALGGGRVALATWRWDDDAQVLLFDAATAQWVRTHPFAEQYIATVGLGAAGFAVVTSPRAQPRTPRRWDVGEGAPTGGEELGWSAWPLGWTRAAWDGPHFAAQTGDGLRVRGPGVQDEHFATGLSSLGAFRLAFHDADWIVAVGASFAIRGETQWTMRADAPERHTTTVAHASRAHRGAFLLDETDHELAWVGWACDPR